MPAVIIQPIFKPRVFHTLNALRFFAIFKIFTQHLPFDQYHWLRYVKYGGTYFFFMLTGFLITYSIMEEKLHTGKLDLKNFWGRRILRIWPLFYLVVGLCYILPPILRYMGIGMVVSGYEGTLWVSLLFLEDYKMIITGSMPDVYPMAGTWSICIQEHFYIVWSLILVVLPVRHIPKLIAISIITAIAARTIFVLNGIDPADILTCLDIFAYGAMAAYLLIKYGDRLEKWVNSIPKAVQAAYVVILLSIVLVFAHTCGLIIKPILFGLLFSFLLVLTFPANAFIKISEKNIFSRLGVYAYGIFAFHIFVIISCKKIFEYYHIPLDNGWVAICFSIITFLLTIACAALSYKYFEGPFLKLKRYFRK